MVLRTMGGMEDVPAFADLIVATYEGRPIRVRDIGRVENGVTEPRSRARLDDKNAVSLIVKKQSGTNVVSVTVGNLPSTCGGATLQAAVSNGSTSSTGSATVPSGGGSVVVTLGAAVALAAADETDLVLTGP